MELFHRIADTDSAAIRRLVTALDIKDEIDFRNVDTGETAAQDWRARGGTQIPALWTGDELVQGRTAIEEYLNEITHENFPELLDGFDAIAADVWDELKKIIPAEFAEPISRVQFIILDEPDEDLLADLPEEMAEHPEELFGLHVGTPMTKASVFYPDPLPVRVYVFRWALIDSIEPEEKNPERALREEIAITLLHEIGHYFGLEEDDLDRLGYG